VPASLSIPGALTGASEEELKTLYPRDPLAFRFRQSRGIVVFCSLDFSSDSYGTAQKNVQACTSCRAKERGFSFDEIGTSNFNYRMKLKR